MTSGSPADLVLINADVLPVVGRRAPEGMVACRDGAIIFVGRMDQGKQWVSSAKRVVDCLGRSVLPGFHDAHIHLDALAEASVAVYIGPPSVTTLTALLDALRSRADSVATGEWVVGVGHDEFWLYERRHPTLRELDAAFPNHPVKILHRSRHAQILNSLAFEKLGMSSGSPGVELGQDGSPTGFVLTNAVPPDRAATSYDSVRLVETSRRLLALGLTSVQDASRQSGLAFHRTVAGIGFPRPRVTTMLGFEHLASANAEGLRFGSGDQWTRLGHCKLMLAETLDGFSPTPSELTSMVAESWRRGFPVAIHCVDESEVAIAIECVRAAGSLRKRPAGYNRLEHASVAPPSLLADARDVGLGICTQPIFVFSSGDRYLEQIEDWRIGSLYAVKAMLDAGLSVAAGSDAPVASHDPLVSIRTSVTRRSRGGQAVVKEQGVSLEQALALHTLAPAVLGGQGDCLGSLEVGKWADLVVLSGRLEDVLQENSGLLVDATIVGGRIGWSRDQSVLN